MALFKISKSTAAVAENSGSNYISASGIYDAIIKFASLDVSKGGAESVNFNLDYNGNEQTIYGPYVTNKAGDAIEIGCKLINNLAIIANMDEGAEPTIEPETHSVGKDKKAKEFAVIQEFSGLPIKIRLQEEYSRNPQTGEVTKKMVIKAFYREDGASASEIVNGTPIGESLAKDRKYENNITYADSSKGANDAPTPEEVAAWKASKKPGATPAKAPAPKAAAAKPTSSLFAK